MISIESLARIDEATLLNQAETQLTQHVTLRDAGPNQIPEILSIFACPGPAASCVSVCFSPSGSDMRCMRSNPSCVSCAGEPIEQMSEATEEATHGQLVLSKHAHQVQSTPCHWHVTTAVPTRVRCTSVVLVGWRLSHASGLPRHFLHLIADGCGARRVLTLCTRDLSAAACQRLVCHRSPRSRWSRACFWAGRPNALKDVLVVRICHATPGSAMPRQDPPWHARIRHASPLLVRGCARYVHSRSDLGRCQPALPRSVQNQ